MFDNDFEDNPPLFSAAQSEALDALEKTLFWNAPTRLKYFGFILSPKPQEAAKRLIALGEAGLLKNQWQYLDLSPIWNNRSWKSAVQALKLLKENDLLAWLTEDDPYGLRCRQLLSRGVPLLAAEAFVALKQAGFWDLIDKERLIALVFQRNRSKVLCDALQILQDEQLLTTNMLDLVLSHLHPESLAKAIRTLNQLSLLHSPLGQQLLNVLRTTAYPHQIVLVIPLLQSNNILNLDNFKAVSRKPHYDSKSRANVLSALKQMGLFEGQEQKRYRQALNLHKNPERIHQIIDRISALRLEDFPLDERQAYFRYLLAENQSPLFDKEIWRMVPGNLPISAVALRELKRLAAQEGDYQARKAALIAYMRQHILPQDPIQQKQAWQFTNDAQSTHNSSVHLATDLTALCLIGAQPIIPDSAFKDLLCWVQDNSNDPSPLPEDYLFKKNKAVDCINRIQAISFEFRLDPDKKRDCLRLLQTMIVNEAKNVREAADNQLLESCYQNIAATEKQTHKLKLGSFIALLFQATKQRPEAKLPWVMALYEIQRGYNLNETGVDDGALRDRPICPGGTANKFCEQLVGLSPYIHFSFVSPETIVAKIKLLFLDSIKAKADNLLREGKKAELAVFLEQICGENSDEAYQRLFAVEQTQSYIKENLELEFNGLAQKAELERCFAESSTWIPYLPSLGNPETKAWPKQAYQSIEVLQRLAAAEHQPSPVLQGLFQAPPSPSASTTRKRRREDVETEMDMRRMDSP